MAALPKVLSNHAHIKSAGGVALRVRTQAMAIIIAAMLEGSFREFKKEETRAGEEKKRADAAQAQLYERHCTLSIGSLTCTLDHLGKTRWVIRAINDGPAPAEDVQIELVKLEPHPRDDRWPDHYPQKVRL